MRHYSKMKRAYENAILIAIYAVRQNQCELETFSGKFLQIFMTALDWPSLCSKFWDICKEKDIN